MLFERTPFDESAEVTAPPPPLSPSTCTAADSQIRRQLKMGHPQLRLLYVTPEGLFGGRNADAFWTAYRQKQIRRIVVDEVSIFALRLSS